MGAGLLAARQCVELSGEEAVGACRRALALGLPAGRAAALRRVLAVKLADLQRWDEVIEVYRQGAEASPADPEAWRRLGSALLHLAGRPAEAVAPLQAAIGRRPGDPLAQAELGVALAALGRTTEATAAFDEAARLDPGFFESRPAAQAIYEAARRGEGWP